MENGGAAGSVSLRLFLTACSQMMPLHREIKIRHKYWEGYWSRQRDGTRCRYRSWFSTTPAPTAQGLALQSDSVLGVWLHWELWPHAALRGQEPEWAWSTVTISLTSRDSNWGCSMAEQGPSWLGLGPQSSGVHHPRDVPRIPTTAPLEERRDQGVGRGKRGQWEMVINFTRNGLKCHHECKSFCRRNINESKF